MSKNIVSYFDRSHKDSKYFISCDCYNCPSCNRNNIKFFVVDKGSFKEWRIANPNKEGNIRDYSSVLQLLVLANLKAMNAEFIRENIPQMDRLKRLNAAAIAQLKSLTNNNSAKLLLEKQHEP